MEELETKFTLRSQVLYPCPQIPLPGCRVIPLAAIPTQGKDTAEDNATLLLRCREICEELGLSVLSCGSDGASAEVGAHEIIDKSPQASGSVSLSIEKYGYEVTIPVFSGTGPLVTIPDPSHVRKVLRDNEQSGTHLLTLGDHYLAHTTLVALQVHPQSGLVKKDVVGTDKQDDGAAIRLYHSNALRACFTIDGGSVNSQFALVFVLHFVFGKQYSRNSSRCE